MALATAIAGLAPGTLYHYCVVATNDAGTVIGQDATFTTGFPTPTASTLDASNVAPRSAVLNATVNPQGAATTCYFQHGLTTSYGSASDSNALAAGTIDVPLATPIAGLIPGTLYHYCVVATSSGGTTTGQDATFTTPNPPPTASTLAASDVTTGWAVLNATVNPQGAGTTCYFQYGLTTNYGSVSATNTLTPGTTDLAVATAIAGLTPGTLYHYCVVATSSGGTAAGQDATFTTPYPPPTAFTLAASDVTTGSAMLNATVNPQGAATTCYFQYGLTTNYGSLSATNVLPPGTSDVAVATPIAGLAPGTLYHYCVVATSSGGRTIGQDATFTTLDLPPVQFSVALTSQGGSMQLSLASASGASFTVLSTTNLALPLSNWTVLGPMTETVPGQYEFTDPQPATNPQCYYRVRTP